MLSQSRKVLPQIGRLQECMSTVVHSNDTYLHRNWLAMEMFRSPVRGIYSFIKRKRRLMPNNPPNERSICSSSNTIFHSYKISTERHKFSMFLKEDQKTLQYLDLDIVDWSFCKWRLSSVLSLVFLSSFIASLDATFTHFSPCTHSEQQWVQDFACWFFLILKICSSNPRAFQNAHCRSPVSQRLTFSCSVSSSEWICLKFIPRGWLWQV